MSRLDQQLKAELDRLRAENLYRVRRVVDGPHGSAITVDGRRCVNFCGNDYLGLAADPRVAEAAREALARTGTGSGAASLVSGYNREHRALEEELASFLGRPRALLFASGWAANLGVLRALLGRNDTFVADDLNHASLIDGGRLSGAHYVRYPHADAAAAARAMQVGRGRVLVATDTVFSMDGDHAPLRGLAAACERHGATLMADDAHGFGVLGPDGRGAVAGAALSLDDVPIYMATLGKALGVAGAFVAGSETLVEYLVQRARTWVFSTAPPPALAAAARKALAIARAEPERRAHLTKLVERFRLAALDLGLPATDAPTAIQPVVLGSEARALRLSEFLVARGFWVAAIRPPTVPPGTSRLRITFSASHTEAEVDGLLAALADGLRDLKTLGAAA